MVYQYDSTTPNRNEKNDVSNTMYHKSVIIKKIRFLPSGSTVVD